MKRKMAAHIISVTVCLAVLISSVLGSGVLSSFAAANTGDAGANIVWSYNASTTTLTLSGSGATYTFRASSLGSHKRAPWESYKSNITKLVVGEGITELGDYAFYNCTALTSVQLPSTLTAIDGTGTMELSYGCFQNCTALKTITLPNSLESIGTCAFKGCSSLRLIRFPDSLTSLAYGAFCDCASLTTVTFGNGMTSTGTNAFYNSGVKKINFSPSINTVDNWSFFNTRIVELEIPDTVSAIGTRAFSDCTFISDVTVYNRDCEFRGIIGEDPFNGSNQELIIHGYTGSTAEVYAIEHNYAFLSLDNCNHLTTHDVVVTQPTCTESGVSNIVCDECGDVIRTAAIEPTGHDYEVISADDQTQFNGHIYNTYKCTVCDDTYTAPVHQEAPEGSLTTYVWVPGYFTYTNTSTCTTAGYERYVCTVEDCSRTENHLITSPDHNVVSWQTTVQPTCTEPGTRSGRCVECNAIVEAEIAPLGHTVDSEHPISVSDKTAIDGHIYKTCVCSVCGDTTTVVEHTAWIEGVYTPNMIVTATCTINGRERDKCDICGETRELTITAVGSHDFQIYSTTEPSCTVRGTTVYKCTQCDNQYTTYGDALGHDYIKSANENLAPTCLDQGYDQYYCSRCSSSKREVVPAMGHDPADGTYFVTKAPTCETKGSASGDCQVCGLSYTLELDALGHEYEDVSVPIDSKPGHSYVTPTCIRCGNTQASTISHDEWLEGRYTSQVINEPGCIVRGNRLDTCTICNTTRNVPTEALGHAYIYTGTLSTSNGDMIFQCRHCRLPYTQSSHIMMDQWTMEHFGEPPIRSADATTSYYDVNGDDVINAKDYAWIMNTVKEYDQRLENGEFDDDERQIDIDFGDRIPGNGQ